MVKSLFDICTNVCLRNIHEITDIGGAPYSLLRPIIMKMDNPNQLRELEEHSPHLRGDTAECWERFIQRDFRRMSEVEPLVPSDPTLWCKIYFKYKKIDDARAKAARELLHSRFKVLKKERVTKATSLVDFDAKVLGPLPGSRRGRRNATTHTAAKPKTTGQSFIQKTRREAAERNRRSTPLTPTGQLPVRPGQITHAPMGMVEEYRIKSLPNVKGIQPPQQRAGQRWEREQEERDARLLKLKNGGIPKGATVVSDTDLLEDSVGTDASDIETDASDDEKADTRHSAKTTDNATSARPQSQSSSFSRPSGNAPLSALAKMKMNLSKPKDLREELVLVPTKKAKPSSEAPKSGPPPPPRPSSTAKHPLFPPRSPGSGTASNTAGTAGPSTDPKPNPRPMPKRKQQPNVFMPKPKARRMS
ncbi:RNA polymerase II transcription factor SIII subunit A-domain-containing protein [Hypoxylon sp. NC1633]|nr:RNA polymerase II transcription factor SIII subunit A-domain-containing protein [Hypoxylon sp. NC1633]